jgi:hypothetical protein
MVRGRYLYLRLTFVGAKPKQGITLIAIDRSHETDLEKFDTNLKDAV